MSFIELFHWCDQDAFRTEPPEYAELFRRLAVHGVRDPESVCLSRIGEPGPWSKFGDLANRQALLVCRDLCRERLIDEELPPAWPVDELGIPRRPIGTPKLFAQFLRDEAVAVARAEVDFSQPDGAWVKRVRSLLKTAWNAADLWRFSGVSRGKVARDLASVCGQLLLVANCLDSQDGSVNSGGKVWQAALGSNPCPDKPKKGENKLPASADVDELCKYLRKNRSKFATNVACVREFCRKNGISEHKAENLVRQARRYRHLWE